jgi:hypothetical protein
MIERSVATGLITAELGAELERSRLLRDRVARGAVTSAALTPTGAIGRVRAVLDAVALLIGSAPGTAAEPGQAQPASQLARLWEEHLSAPFPEGFRGVDVGGVDLVLLDADVAGLVQRELNGGLDDQGVAILWARIADLDKIVPLLNEEYCAAYFARLRTVAGHAAVRYIPTAT